MSLGFTPMHHSEVMRRQTGAGIESIRPPSNRRAGGSNPGSASTSTQDTSPPIKLRVEVLEIALRTLSENVQELEDKVDNGTTSDMRDKDDTLESGTSTLLGEHLDKRVQILEEKLNTLAINPNKTVTTSNTDHGAEPIPGSHIRAEVSQGGAQMYLNTSGNFREDVKGSPTTLPAGSKVRLFFPQQQLDNGRVCMGVVHVDDNMTLHSGWLVICNTATGDRYVENFEV